LIPPADLGLVTRGLSIRQPWVWLMTEPRAEGAPPPKRIENRSWHLPPSMRGQWFAVCASARTSYADYASAGRYAAERGVLVPHPGDPALVRGAVVAVARAFECLCPPGLGFAPRPWGQDLRDRDLDWWMNDQHGHVWRDVWRLPEPVPVRGALGFFALPPDVVFDVDEQIRSAQKEGGTDADAR